MISIQQATFRWQRKESEFLYYRNPSLFTRFGAKKVYPSFLFRCLTSASFCFYSFSANARLLIANQSRKRFSF